MKERTSIEQVRERNSELLASSTDTILIIVADAGEERTFLMQARERSGGELLATVHGYHPDYRCRRR